MKKIKNFVLASAAATLLLTGCAEDYQSDFNVNKPESVALAETLNAYDVLKNYTGIHLGAEIASDDALAQNALYSLVLANFNEVTLSDAFSYAGMVADNGDIDTLTVEKAVANAANSGMNVFATAMFNPAQFNVNYMKELTKDTWVEGTQVDTYIVEDFEKYDAGSKLDGDGFSVIAKDPAGQNGKVFSNTKNAKFMSIPIQLPEGAKLKDVQSISFDYRSSNIKKILLLRVKAGESIAEKQFDKPEAKDQWAHYELSMTSLADNITAEDMEANTFSIMVGQGATPQKVYVDNIKLHVAYKTEGYYVDRPAAEKAADVKKGLDAYADALVKKYGDRINTWTVASDLLDDFLGEMKSTDATGDPSEFYPNDYLGDNYVADVCKTIHAVKPDMKLFYEESNMLGNDMKQEGLKNYLAQWNEAGAQIAGVNIKVDLPYHADILEDTKAQYETLLNSLKETGLLVRLSDLNVYPADKSGAIQGISQVTTAQLKEMASFYTYIVNKYLEIIPENQRYGLSFSHVNASNVGVGLWSNYNRLPTYVGVANGLQSKETTW